MSKDIACSFQPAVKAENIRRLDAAIVSRAHPLRYVRSAGDAFVQLFAGKAEMASESGMGHEAVGALFAEPARGHPEICGCTFKVEDFNNGNNLTAHITLERERPLLMTENYSALRYTTQCNVIHKNLLPTEHLRSGSHRHDDDL